MTESTARKGVSTSLDEYLASAREVVLDELDAIIPKDHSQSGNLYSLMLDYPLRGGKSLRPALAIASCRGLGGTLAAVACSAAVLELYHNAFLVHDDVEDGSELRRHEPTLSEKYGSAIAVNVGDGMLAVCMKALLDNAVVVGLGPALRAFHVIARMARETAEGQMVELQWIRRRQWWVAESAYIRMVHKKTAWYSFIAPMLLGAIAANDDRSRALAIHRFASSLGVAFQITDDLLNLEEVPAYGKEHEGDLWEGKLTLMLLHALHQTAVAERHRATEVLARPRPRHGVSTPSDRTADDVAWLRDLIDRHGGVEHARDVAADYAHRAKRQFESLAADWGETAHRRFIEGLVTYVTDRDR